MFTSDVVKNDESEGACVTKYNVDLGVIVMRLARQESRMIQVRRVNKGRIISYSEHWHGIF